MCHCHCTLTKHSKIDRKCLWKLKLILFHIFYVAIRTRIHECMKSLLNMHSKSRHERSEQCLTQPILKIGNLRSRQWTQYSTPVLPSLRSTISAVSAKPRENYFKHFNSIQELMRQLRTCNYLSFDFKIGLFPRDFPSRAPLAQYREVSPVPAINEAQELSLLVSQSIKKLQNINTIPCWCISFEKTQYTNLPNTSIN